MAARAEVLKQINAVMSANCKGCPTRRAKVQRSGVAHAEQYCNKKCPVGKQLQKLGRSLSRGAEKPMNSPRQRRREWVHPIKAKGEEYGASIYKNPAARMGQKGQKT
ncbi:zinc-finger domain-containing protein [Cohnella sp. GCM10020058]|uniref:zinc-finger domain-containing protein n=1 Tax=Cohnella sp. GCM10020058 TaxID=3317330 RepID=UPI003641D8FA